MTPSSLHLKQEGSVKFPINFPMLARSLSLSPSLSKLM